MFIGSRSRQGIPIAYPRMVFLETALESKFNPLISLGKSGTSGLSGFFNKFNSDAELLDDLVRFLAQLACFSLTISDVACQSDHWTAKSHKVCCLRTCRDFRRPRPHLGCLHTERTELVHRAAAAVCTQAEDPDHVRVRRRALRGMRCTQDAGQEERAAGCAARFRPSLYAQCRD
jgi:hypothetical protein